MTHSGCCLEGLEGSDHCVVRVIIPELLTSDPLPSDTPKQPPFTIWIPPKSARLGYSDRRRGGNLRRSHAESEDDLRGDFHNVGSQKFRYFLC